MVVTTPPVSLELVTHSDKTMQGDGNSTGTGNPGGYCYAEQPAWSAYREPSFGHGTLDIVNSTTALWYAHALTVLHACCMKHSSWLLCGLSCICDMTPVPLPIND